MASALREGRAPSRAFMGTLWPLPVGVQYEAGVQARGDGDLDQGGSHVDKGQWSDRRSVLEAELPMQKVRPGGERGLGGIR